MTSEVVATLPRRDDSGGMRQHLVTAVLLIAGIVHLLPLLGILGAPKLAALYGVAIAEPNLEILMRHRAALFGLVSWLLVAAALRPELQSLGLAVGLFSVVSFLAVAWSVGGMNAQLARVAAIDAAVLALLLIAALLRLTART